MAEASACDEVNQNHRDEEPTPIRSSRQLSCSLDYIRCLREVALVGPHCIVEPTPTRPRWSLSEKQRPINQCIELTCSKSLNTRPNGKSWRNSFDQICTPCSLDDLGDFKCGRSVDLAASFRSDYPTCILPYCISIAHKCLVLVQHVPGYNPNSASFLFVGQRSSVANVFAVPWRESLEFAETLPEARNLGHVLFVQSTGRCGSTIFVKSLEWLGLCQTVSEPDVLGDIHEMLENDQCSIQEAISMLRSSILILVNRMRKIDPQKPIIIIKPRSLTAVWRHCALLSEALPGCKQIFLWRRVDNVVASFDAAIKGAMISPLTRILHDNFMADGVLWRLEGSAVRQFMDRLARAMSRAAGQAGSRNVADIARINASAFARYGALGFSALNVIFSFHVAKALGDQNLWSATLSYEVLMEGRSSATLALLQQLDWLKHFDVESVAKLGSSDADTVFGRDAHQCGGLSKQGGTKASAVKSQPADPGFACGAEQTTEHLPLKRAEALVKLLALHKPLFEARYILDCGCPVTLPPA